MSKLAFILPAALIAYTVWQSIAPVAAEISATLAALPF